MRSGHGGPDPNFPDPPPPPLSPSIDGDHEEQHGGDLDMEARIRPSPVPPPPPLSNLFSRIAGQFHSCFSKSGAIRPFTMCYDLKYDL